MSWRDGADSLQGLYDRMLRGRIGCDLILHVRDSNSSTEIHCHSSFLVANSPMFEQLLQDRKQNLKLSEEPKSFINFIEMMYLDWQEGDDLTTHEFPKKLKTTDLVRIIGLAEKYGARRVVTICHHIVTIKLRGAEIEEIVKLYKKIKNGINFRPSIFFVVENAICGLGFETFSTDAHFYLDQADIVHLLSKNEFCCPEECIYTGSIRWATEMCRRATTIRTGEKIRAALGPILNKIRFPILDDDFITDYVEDANVLDEKEMVDLLMLKLDPQNPRYKMERFCDAKRNPRNVITLNLSCAATQGDSVLPQIPISFGLRVSEEVHISRICFHIRPGHAEGRHEVTISIKNITNAANNSVVRKLTGHVQTECQRFVVHIDPALYIPKYTEVEVETILNGVATMESSCMFPKEFTHVYFHGLRLEFTFKEVSLPSGILKVAAIDFKMAN